MRAADESTMAHLTAPLTDLLARATEQLDESVLITESMLDAPGPRIVYVNRAFTGMTGYTAEDVLGKTPRILQGPETDRAVLERLRSQLERGERFEGQTVNYRKGGTPFVIRWYIETLRDPEGVITHFMAVQRDVTEQVRESRHRRRLETALARSSSPVAMFDDAGKLLYRNAACDAVMPGGLTTLRHQTVWQAGLWPQGRATAAEIRRHLRTAEPWRGEIELRDRSAARRLFDTVIVPVLDEIAPEGERPDCFVAIAADVTKNRRLEAIAEAHNLADVAYLR